MTRKVKQIACIVVLIFSLTNCMNATQSPTFVPASIDKPTSTPAVVFASTPSPVSTSEIKNVVLEKSISPDESWIAVISLKAQGKNKNLLFKVSNNSNSQEWVVDQIDWNELQTPTSLVLFPYIFKWSQDNIYLYYSYLPNFNDGCFGYFRPGGFSLKRLDLSNGTMVTLREGEATWMVLSPDEKQLAYINTFGGNVSILDLENSMEETYPLPSIDSLGMITDTSDMYWSPDGKSLIYTYYIGACDLNVPYSNIIQLFPDLNKQKVLVSNNQDGYIPIEWNIQDSILLKDSEDKNWWLNPITKEINPANQ